MIYDCFSFFNELDLLEIRLNVLKDVVDKFVLVEAGETHTGKPKPCYFEENRGRFAAFADRIVYLKIEKFPEGHGAWWNENYQRNQILQALERDGAKPDDIVLISDMDEIPNPEAVIRHSKVPGVYDFRLTSYAFYLNMRDVRTPYTVGTRMLSYHDLLTGFDGVDTFYNEFLPEELNRGTTVTKIRRRDFPKSKGGIRKLWGAGWHFTCLGGAKAVLSKMRAVAPHHDFDPDDPTLTVETVEAMLSQGKGVALKMDCFAEKDFVGLPEFVVRNRARYAHLLFAVTPEYLRRVRWARFARTVQGRFKHWAERMCPTAVHNWLHRIRMRALGCR